MPFARVIPILLLDGRGLVKTRKFRDSKYVGDPINTVRIFNEKEVDEIVLLDIRASAAQRAPNIEMIREVAGECFMPLCYGGGIHDLRTIESILSLGVEKVALNTAALDRPELISEAATEFGSQSIMVSMDVKTRLFGAPTVYSNGGTRPTIHSAVEWARRAESLGAGEILLTSIDRDGSRIGYDVPLIRSVVSAVEIPVVAAGGADGVSDLAEVLRVARASAAAAGSMFVFHGRHRAVLITYPDRKTIDGLLET